MDKNTTEKNFSEKLKGLSKKEYFLKKIAFIAIFILLFILLFTLLIFFYNYFNNKITFEKDVLGFANKNENTIFSINKCVFFSGVDTKNKTSSITNFTVENLYQYTDMAFFINNNSSTNSYENTLKSLYINNINYNTYPELGSPSLYYKDLNNFAKSEIVDNNLINNDLNFSVSAEDTIDFSTPTLYNNCANPIVLSYVNSNVKTDYTILDTSSPITYDGSLLKRCGVMLDSIKCTLSFDVYLTNNLDQEFKTTVYVNIPLQSQDSTTSIYDGKYSEKKDTNYTFYRYK